MHTLTTVADRRCAEICPSVEEIGAKASGDRQYQRWLEECRPDRKLTLPF